MKVLIDAQLPVRLKNRLLEAGHDVVHTLDLPLGNRTPDAMISQLTIQEKRVLITKDADFVDSLIIQGIPYKLLLVSTGNIRNSELEQLLFSNLEALIDGFDNYDFIEIDSTALRFHF